MGTVKFKPEYEKKLKKLKVKTKLVKNINKLSFKLTQEEANSFSKESWGDFIRQSFMWDITPEGVEFWDNIANS